MVMKVVIVDHQDSFTYNIVELIRKAVGLEPAVFPANNLDIKTLSKFDKIILSPGPGLPKDFMNIKHIIDTYKTTKHILGICLGHQAIATYFGAKLINMKTVVHGQPAVINHKTEHFLFRNMPKNFQAGLYHSWVVSKEKFPRELEITALSADNKIMALSHCFYKIYGVQFHPESYITKYGEQLIKNFLNA